MFKIPRSSIFFIIFRRGPMTKTKSMSDNGLHCLKPLACWTFALGSPFMIILLEARSDAIQFLYCLLHYQLIESKAFICMFSFMKRACDFVLCYSHMLLYYGLIPGKEAAHRCPHRSVLSLRPCPTHHISTCVAGTLFFFLDTSWRVLFH